MSNYISFAIMTFALTLSSSCGSEFAVLLEGRDAYYGTTGLYCVEKGSGGSDGRITRYDTGGNSSQVVLTGLTEPNDCAVDLAGGYLYWVEDRGANEDLVRRALLDGTSAATLNTGSTHSDGPYGIALDLSAGHVFWTDPGHLYIHRCDLDGGNHYDRFLNNTDLSVYVYRIRIDTAGSFIYFSQNDIHRATLMENAPTAVFVDVTGDDCRGIALDVPGDMIYWTGTNSIGRARLSDPADKNESFIAGLSDPDGIDLDLENRVIYWTDRTEGRIYRALMDDAAPTAVTVISGLTDPVSLIISR